MEFLRPDPAYLHERLRYDPATGKLFWREHPSMRPQWNSKHAGSEAFTAKDQGYLVGRIDGRRLYAHRVIFAMLHGYWPDEVDHENHDRGDNMPGNLLAATDKSNSKNQSLQRRSISGAPGVSWDATRRKWHARICSDGERLHLGYFHDLNKATSVRKQVERDHGFHPNHGNF